MSRSNVIQQTPGGSGAQQNPGGIANGSKSSKNKKKLPLVVQLEGRDCSIEMPILRNLTTVAFCDANSFEEVHEKALLEAAGVFVSNGIHLGRDQLALFQSLKCLVKIGPGLLNVDLEAAGQLGIAVCHITGYGIEEAADTTLQAILQLRMNVIRSGGMSFSERVRTKTLGIVGLTRVGKAVAVRARALGYSVFYYDPYHEGGYDGSYDIKRVDFLHELLTQCDVVSLHCGLNQFNVKMINEETIKQMRPKALLVNMKDIGLVDEGALAAALHGGKLAGAALDTFRPDHEWGPLVNAPNLVITPGTAYLSETSMAEFREAAALEMKTYFEVGLSTTVPNKRLRYIKNGVHFGI